MSLLQLDHYGMSLLQLELPASLPAWLSPCPQHCWSWLAPQQLAAAGTGQAEPPQQQLHDDAGAEQQPAEQPADGPPAKREQLPVSRLAKHSLHGTPWHA
jgi:hypothetical protein